MPVLPVTLQLTAREQELLDCVRCATGRIDTESTAVAGAIGRYHAARDLAGLNYRLAKMRAAVVTLETTIDELANIAASQKGPQP